MPDLARRSPELEWMDDPAVGTARLRRALEELETINRWLGGHRPSLGGIGALAGNERRELSVLDVGTGGGDLPRRLLAWGLRRGIRVRSRGIDRSADAIAWARERSAGLAGLDFAAVDLFDLDPAERWDVVHGALLLHHLTDQEAVRALRRMDAMARLGVVVNDLHRHPAAYHAIRLLAAALSRSDLIRHDAPLSVWRAFRRPEIEALGRAAGLAAPAIRWRWAFRWQVVFRHSGSPGA